MEPNPAWWGDLQGFCEAAPESAVLERKPLGYRVVRQSGSHRRMEAPGRAPLTFAFHDKATIPSGLVRKVLTKDAGLAEDEALKLL